MKNQSEHPLSVEYISLDGIVIETMVLGDDQFLAYVIIRPKIYS